jgi:rare lipoprotein A (peptidoglycan hydrolase)
MIFKFFLLTFLLIANSAFASSSYSKLNNILHKNHKKYLRLNGYQAEGPATYYARKFHGRKTASGMKYLKGSYTAASTKLPLLSVVKVTNAKTGRTISVLINDRGSFATSLLDLSEAAAKAIKLSGREKIYLEFDLDTTLALKSDKNLLDQKFKL